MDQQINGKKLLVGFVRLFSHVFPYAQLLPKMFLLVHPYWEHNTVLSFP